MHPLNRWLPGREADLALLTLLDLALIGLALLLRDTSEALPLLLFALEVGLPVALGIAAAGLLVHDPILDLLLSVPQPASRTLIVRLVVLFGYGLGLAMVTLLVARALPGTLPIVSPQQPLIWAAPALLFVGLGTAGALVRGRMLDGVLWVLVVAGLAVLARPLMVGCPMDPGSGCPAALFTPLITLLRPHDSLWLANRLLWAGVGGALLLTGLWRVRREEPLLTGQEGG